MIVSNEVDDVTIRVDHLEYKGNGSQNADWVHPDGDDIQEAVTLVLLFNIHLHTYTSTHTHTYTCIHLPHKQPTPTTHT